MRLIYADDVKKEIDDWLDVVGDVVIGKHLSYYGEFLGCIEDAPTVEAVPVVRGKWIKGIYGWHCSECVESFGPELYYECGYKKPNFCPNCGARMVKDNE